MAAGNSVSKGPVDVTYGWKEGDGPVHDQKRSSFGGTGRQSQTVFTHFAEMGYGKQYSEQLVVTDHLYSAGPGTAIFTITCGATASVPVARNQSIACGAKTTFTSTLHVAVPQDVRLSWHFSDGSGTGLATVYVDSSLAKTLTSPQVTVTAGGGCRRGTTAG